MLRMGRWGGCSQWGEVVVVWKEVALGWAAAREQGRRPGTSRRWAIPARVGHGVCGPQEGPAGEWGDAGWPRAQAGKATQAPPWASAVVLVLLGGGWRGGGAGDALFLRQRAQGSPGKAQGRDRGPLGGLSSNLAPAEVQVGRPGCPQLCPVGGVGGGGRRSPTEERGGRVSRGRWRAMEPQAEGHRRRSSLRKAPPG